MRRRSLALVVGPGPDHAGPEPVLTPYVDGTSLVELVGAFEGGRRWSPAGRYDGLARWHLGPDLAAYYGGRAERDGAGGGRAWLLGCTCGQPGCWPLDARIGVQRGTVTWDDFRQPHRPEQDYAGLGPFVFSRPAYERAVRDAAAALA